MTPLWSEAPRILVEQPFDFMYSADFDPNRNLNAMVRFVIYWSVLIYALTRQPVVFAILVALLLLMRRPAFSAAPIVTEDLGADSKIYCQTPSRNNPLANPTHEDLGHGRSKLPACPSGDVKGEVRRVLRSQPITGDVYAAGGGEDANFRLAERSVYSIPPDARDEYQRAVYGDNIGRSLETGVGQ